MQPIASWLVARPQNAILGLAATLMLPFALLFSGALMALLVLHHGPARSALHALIASALLVAISLILKTSAIQILANGLVTWLPVLLLASLLRHWRSLALTLQVSVIAAVAIMLVFYAAVPDPTAFWKSILNEMALVFAQMELQGQADILLTQQDVIAPQMTILVVFTSWSLYVAVLLLGYALMQTLPGQSHCFGRFADLGLGRVLAITMAMVSLTAMASGANWLQNIAFLLFAVFWIQGLAMAHWLHAEKRLPGIAVVLVYVLLPVLNLLMVLGLAVAGYVDAWFGFRQRVMKQNG